MENPQYAPDHGAHGSIYRGSGGKTQDQISEKKKQERIKEDRQRLKEFIEKERRQAKAARGDSGRFQRDVAQEQQRRIEEKRKRKEQRDSIRRDLEERKKQRAKDAAERERLLQEAEKLRIQKEAEELRRQKEAEELRRQKEVEDAKQEFERLQKAKEAERQRKRDADLAVAREVPEDVIAKAQDIQNTPEGQKITDDDIRVANELEKKKELQEKLKTFRQKLNDGVQFDEESTSYFEVGDIIRSLAYAGLTNYYAIVSETKPDPNRDDGKQLLAKFLNESGVENPDDGSTWTKLTEKGQGEIEAIKQEMRDLLAQNVPVNSTEKKMYNRKLRDIIKKANQAGINNATLVPETLEDRQEKLRFLLGERDEDTIEPGVSTGTGRSANAVRRRNQINRRRDNILKLQDDHPMMLAKPAAPQLHMEKLHIQTGPNMKKLDLDTTSEAKEEDVELDDAECGMEHAEMSFKDLENKAKQMKEKAKKMYKKAKKKAGKAMDKAAKGIDKIMKTMPKESAEPLTKENLRECEKCGEVDDHFHVCAEDLSKPKCISDDIAERKLRELM